MYTIASLEIKFTSLFENVVLGSFNIFFHLDHQVGIGLYCTEATALGHSEEIIWFETIMICFHSH